MNKILVITSSYDKTVDYIQSKFLDIDFFRLNTDFFSEYEIEVNGNGFEIQYKNESIMTKTCTSIYYRKPDFEKLDSVFSTHYQNFVRRECLSLIEGIADSFDKKCLSKPYILKRSGNKIFQSQLAKKVGFVFPSPKISNRLCKTVMSSPHIVKPISTGEIISGNQKEYVQTNLFDKNIGIESLKYCPVYFQEFIDKDYDVRLTIISDTLFCVKITSENNIDWRASPESCNYSIIDVPLPIKVKCLDFMNECDIHFGCFDFIVKNDIWYFLEMNPNGQWAWLELELNINISNKIISYLHESNN